MITRRNYLKLCAAAAGALTAPGILRRSWAADPLVVRIPGGNDEIYGRVMFKPFTEATGIPVQPTVSMDLPYTDFKVSVETGAYRYDLSATISKELITLLRRDNLLEPIDTSSPDIKSRPEGSYTADWLPTALYCFVMCSSTEAFPDRNLTYPDLWDVKEFPGPRGLRKRAVDAIEVAARAIGVPGAEIYTFLAKPGGWDDVFEALTVIRPAITSWWDSDTLLEQQLASGELVMSPNTSYRAQRLIDEGAKLQINFEGGYFSTNGWAIPRGTPKADIAREFISFAAAPEREAEMCKFMPNGPIHPRAFDYLDDSLVRLLPSYPDNLAKMAEQKPEFWLANADYATRRFEEWLLKG